MKRKFPMLFRVAISTIILCSLTSCGSPRTAIRVTNRADGTDTKIHVSQGDGGSTSVSINPALNASIDSVTFNIQKTR